MVSVELDAGNCFIRKVGKVQNGAKVDQKEALLRKGCKKGTKERQKRTKREPKEAKGRQKWAKGRQKEAKGRQNGDKIHQKSIKMVPKTDTSAKVDFGWPKWHQNWSKMEPKGIQNLCKIISKVDAKIMPKRYRKMKPKWIKTDAEMVPKLKQNLSFSRNGVFSKTLLSHE